MIVGVDIGGSHIAAGILNKSSGEIRIDKFSEASVDSSASASDIISNWASLIRSIADAKADLKVGIAMPGPFDYESGISLILEQGKMKSLYGKSIRDLLAKELEIVPANICFMNDAEAFLKGESLAGAGKDYTNTMGLTLGTGLGSAIQVEEIVKDAKLWTAPFRQGIAEDYLGTSWFQKYVDERYSKTIAGARELMEEGFDPSIREEVFKVYGRALGEFLFPYVIRLQTQAVILGGKIANAHSYFLPSAQFYLRNYGVDLSFHISQLGERSTLIGAGGVFL